MRDARHGLLSAPRPGRWAVSAALVDLVSAFRATDANRASFAVATELADFAGASFGRRYDQGGFQVDCVTLVPLADGRDQLQELVQEQRELARSVWIGRAVRTGFLFGTVTMGIAAGPLTPISAAGAAVAVRQFGWAERGTSSAAKVIAGRILLGYAILPGYFDGTSRTTWPTGRSSFSRKVSRKCQSATRRCEARSTV